MANRDEKQMKYQIECIEDDAAGKTAEAARSEPERLEEDPLDNLPDLTSQTGGLPIVTFVLICLAACAIFLMNRMLTAGTALVSVGCVLMIFILLFGMVALIRGMFRRLHDQKQANSWYGISAAVMTIGIVAGIVVGILCWF